jgi:DNA-directed RNA polymerase I, II, and III subunit RPABC3
LELTLDINSEVYRLKQGEKFTFALVSTLDLEGKPDDGYYNQNGKVQKSLRSFASLMKDSV